MAITPTDLFTPQTSIIGRMLEGGTGSLGGILQGVINVGRDLANNAVRSERDFLMEARNNENLLQRRAEQQRANLEADRTFGENVMRDRRDFGFRVSEAERGREVADRNYEANRAAQLFSQGMQGARLAQDAEENQIRREANQLKRDELAATREFNQALIPDAAATASTSPKTPEQLFAEAEIEADAAKAAKNAEAFRAATVKGAEAKAAINARGGDTPAGQRAQEGLEIRRRAEDRTIRRDEAAQQEREAAKQLKEAENLLADTGAFKPQLPQQAIKDGKYVDPAAAEVAKGFDKDRLASERSVATGVSRTDYIAKGGTDLTDLQKKRRGQFWDIVNGQTAAAPATRSAASDYVNQFRGAK